MSLQYHPLRYRSLVHTWHALWLSCDLSFCRMRNSDKTSYRKDQQRSLFPAETHETVGAAAQGGDERSNCVVLGSPTGIGNRRCIYRTGFYFKPLLILRCHCWRIKQKDSDHGASELTHTYKHRNWRATQEKIIICGNLKTTSMVSAAYVTGMSPFQGNSFRQGYGLSSYLQCMFLILPCALFIWVLIFWSPSCLPVLVICIL